MERLNITEDTSYFDILKYFNELTNYNNKNDKDADSVSWLLGKSKGKIYFEMNINNLIIEILDNMKIHYKKSYYTDGELIVFSVKYSTRLKTRFLLSDRTITEEKRTNLFSILYKKKRKTVIIKIKKKSAINIVEKLAFEISDNIGINCKIII